MRPGRFPPFKKFTYNWTRFFKCDQVTESFRPKKKMRYGIWVLNSLTMIIFAFFGINFILDSANFLAGTLLGFDILYAFDPGVIMFNSEPELSPQLTALFFAEPILLTVLALVSFIMYGRYRRKKDLRKLFFLWCGFFSLSILGGSFLTSFMARGNLAVLWEYVGLKQEFMPLAGLIIALIVLVLGIGHLRNFLNMAPSSVIIKNSLRRVVFVACILVFPLILFYLLMFLLFSSSTVVTRQYSSLLIWVGVLAGFTALFLNDESLRKTPAFRESAINKPLPAWYLTALAFVVICLFLGLNYQSN